MTYLYKVYDQMGCLLYVGQTIHLKQRFHNHNKYAKWRTTYVYVETREFSDHTDALREESNSIFHEKPVYNRNINGRPWSYTDGVVHGPSYHMRNKK